MNAPTKTPFAVLRSIVRHSRARARASAIDVGLMKPSDDMTGRLWLSTDNIAREVAKNTKWSHMMGCYGFDFAGMYIGIELDGYMHS